MNQIYRQDIEVSGGIARQVGVGVVGDRQVVPVLGHSDGLELVVEFVSKDLHVYVHVG